MEVIKRVQGGVVTGSGQDKLFMYEDPPEGELSLDVFCSFALKRLHVLRQIEYQRVRGKNWSEVSNAVLEEFNKFCPSLANQSKAATVEDAQRDIISHYILRLAFCANDEHRRWFLQQETTLFRIRFEVLEQEQVKAFLRVHDLNYEPLTDEEWALHGSNLEEIGRTMQYDSRMHHKSQYFKVHFTKVPDLVKKRNVLLVKGMAVVHQRDLAKVVVGHFRSNMSLALTAASRILPVVLAQESDRLAPFFKTVTDAYMIPELMRDKSSFADSEHRISLSNIWQASEQHFPPCMRNLMRHLRQNHHLKHGGRMQLGLFIKSAGMSMDESLQFWREEFTKSMTADKFNKQYAYTVRHNYGKEGKRVNYSGYGCMKIIQGHVNAGEHHGCPFKHMEPGQIDTLITGMADWKIGQKKEVLDLARNGHHQLACQSTFEAAHPNAPVVQVTHPNEYVKQSLEYAAAKKSASGVKTEAESSPVKTETQVSIKTESAGLTEKMDTAE